MDPVGAHVQQVGEKDVVFITPTCNECNTKAAQDEKFRLKSFKVKFKYLVPFNYNELKKLRHSK